MQKLFPTNTTTWANIEPSSFAVNYSICPTSKDFKWLVRPIGTEKIHFLFCITRVTPPFQLICFRGVILKVCSQDHWSVPETFTQGPWGYFSNYIWVRPAFLYILQPKPMHPNKLDAKAAMKIQLSSVKPDMK